MNRRGFLKSIGKVVVGCAIVPGVAKAKGASQCTCPAPYRTAVSGKPVEHYDYCGAANPEFTSPSAQMMSSVYIINFGSDKFAVHPKGIDIRKILKEQEL